VEKQENVSDTARHFILVELKEAKVSPLANQSGYPDAVPARGIEEATRQFASAGLGFFLDTGKVDAGALSRLRTSLSSILTTETFLRRRSTAKLW
jgi:hypothetical protein